MYTNIQAEKRKGCREGTPKNVHAGVQPCKKPQKTARKSKYNFLGPKISFFVLDFSTYTKQVISFVGYRFETYWLNFQPKQENEPKKTDCQKNDKKVKNAKKK